MAQNKLYSTQRFTLPIGGNGVQWEVKKVVTADTLKLLTTPEHYAQIDALTVGMTTNLVHAADGLIVRDGTRVTRIPEFEHGKLLWDSHAKEYVRVSNGKCVLGHTTAAEYEESHKTTGCIFAAHEALALRPVVSVEKGKQVVRLAWTYRSIDAADLSIPVCESAEYWGKLFDAVLSGDKTIAGGRV